MVLILLIAVGGGIGCYFWLQNVRHEADAQVQVVSEQADAAAADLADLQQQKTSAEEYRQYALTAANESIDNGTLPTNSSIAFTWPHRDPSKLDAIVNKQNPIYPLAFAPSVIQARCGDSTALLITDAGAALTKMCAAMTKDGLSPRVTSSYRSYIDQVATFAYWVSTSGRAKAETYSARPGYSEHQTGTTVDFAVADGPALDSFCGTTEQIWITKHASEYGFIQRYTEENEAETGYAPECWHLRYVGLDVAKDYVTTRASSLEVYWNIKGGGY